MPVTWKIDQPNDFLREFRHLGSIENKLCRQTILDIGTAPDPGGLGILKQTRRHGRCPVVHITGSVSLVYRVYFQEEVIQMVAVGDHKKIYGKD